MSCSGSRSAQAWRARVPGASLDRDPGRVPGGTERVGVRASRQVRRHLAAGGSGWHQSAGRAGDIPDSRFLSAGSEALVIVSSLSRGSGPYPIVIEAKYVAEPAFADRVEEAAPHQRVLAAFRPEILKEASQEVPPSSREFHMMVRDGDVTSSSNYLAVRGELLSPGEARSGVRGYRRSASGGRRSCSTTWWRRSMRRSCRSPLVHSAWRTISTAMGASQYCSQAG